VRRISTVPPRERALFGETVVGTGPAIISDALDQLFEAHGASELIVEEPLARRGRV
jgi:hypothetical protein